MQLASVSKHPLFRWKWWNQCIVNNYPIYMQSNTPTGSVQPAISRHRHLDEGTLLRCKFPPLASHHRLLPFVSANNHNRRRRWELQFSANNLNSFPPIKRCCPQQARWCEILHVALSTRVTFQDNRLYMYLHVRMPTVESTHLENWCGTSKAHRWTVFSQSQANMRSTYTYMHTHPVSSFSLFPVRSSEQGEQ